MSLASTFNTARQNMVDGQLRPNNINNLRLLARFSSVPRELFVDPQVRSHAYKDVPIAIGEDRQMHSPLTQARLIQSLNLQPDDNVMVCGTGMGYGAAIIAGMVDGEVTATEQNKALRQQAQNNLLDCNCDQVIIHPAVLEEGYAKNGPYNAILCSVAVPEIPHNLITQLAPGGRLAAVVQNPQTGLFQAICYTKKGSKLIPEVLCETQGIIPTPLKQAEGFVF